MIKVPEGYLKLDSLPEDPEGLEAYAFVTQSCSAFVSFRPMASHEAAMPVDNPQAVVDGIHACLEETRAW